MIDVSIMTIAAVISSLAALGAFVVSVIAVLRVRELHILVNSRLSELILSASAAARAEGAATGHAAGLAQGIDLERVPTATPPIVVVVPPVGKVDT